MKKSIPTIWIDLENTPHVPLFLPIREELEKHGYNVIMTARDFAQTIELLEMKKVSYHAVGSQLTGGKYLKAAGLLVRAFRLYIFIRKYRVHALLSHGSRSGILAGAFLRVPIITMGDYELSNTLLDNRFSAKVMRPDVTDPSILKKSGLDLGKYVPYPGFKEQIYLSGFQPDKNFRKKVKTGQDDIQVVLRSPATSAHYYNSLSVDIMKAVIHRVLSHKKTRMIALPRTGEERELIRSMSAGSSDRIIFPDGALDGLNLLWNSDVVISGGGTMNREAALLGVPVYSIFTGPKGSVDKALSDRGKLKFISKPEEVSQISIKKRDIDFTFIPPGRDLINFICNEVIKTVSGNAIS